MAGKPNETQQTNRELTGSTNPPFARWPFFAPDEIEAALHVLRSGRVNYWTGEEGRLFEREFAAAVGAEYAIAVANGSVALELALHALEIGPGDEVIVPSRTFVATAGSVVMRGARPVFADIDPTTQNISAQTIAPLLSPRTKAVIVVHLAGWPCDMDPIMKLAADRGLKVIEDCAQAHAATYKGRGVGSIGDIAAFSFCQDKIMTTGGEGGMVVTNEESLWERAWSFKDHGKSWEAVYDRQHPGVFKWVHESIGTNWRLTEMQSAIGRVMLRRLPEWVETRRRNAQVLTDCFAAIDSLRVAVPPEECRHSYYKYYAFLRPERLRDDWSRDRIVRSLQAEGVPCGSGACSEVYLEEAFARAGLQPPERLPVARELGETSLMFPVHPTLSEADMRAIAHATAEVLRAATSPRRESGASAA